MKLKTWDEIKNFDDIVSKDEGKLILSLEKELERRCPHLKKEGNFFYYCGLNIPKTENKELSPFNPIYQRHVNLAEIQMHCMDKFETCCYFSGKIKV